MNKHKKGVKVGQMTLDGRQVTVDDKNDIDLYYYLSVVQKAIRRCNWRIAVKYALKIADVNMDLLLNRLKIIAVEDCLDVETLNAVSYLEQLYHQYKTKFKLWDARRTLVAMVIILSDAGKNRCADEAAHLWLKGIEIDCKENEEAEILEAAKDKHTREGAKLGRGKGTKKGEEWWLEESSLTLNKQKIYEEFRKEYEAKYKTIIEKMFSKADKVTHSTQ